MIDVDELPLEDLRQEWSKAWKVSVNLRVGTAMLRRSLRYKLDEMAGAGLTKGQQRRLGELVKYYNRNPKCFDERSADLKVGTRVSRVWKNKVVEVLITENGFEYEGQNYGSLSKIATEITGTRWNGWLFFGLKKSGGKS